ncbi:MAG: SCP2 sterol-binding domain-containing protein [Bacillota bacterium]
MADAASIFGSLSQRLQERGGKVQGADGVFQFILTGEGAGDYHVAVQGGEASIQEGRAESPAVTISMATADFAALLKGDLNPMSAFFSGRIKVNGDLARALQLQSLLR